MFIEIILTQISSQIQITLMVLTVIVIPLSIWGVGVETRFGKRKGETALNSVEIENQGKDIDCLKEDVKGTNEELKQNHKEVMDSLHQIELQLKDKKDK